MTQEAAGKAGCGGWSSVEVRVCVRSRERMCVRACADEHRHVCLPFSLRAGRRDLSHLTTRFAPTAPLLLHLMNLERDKSFIQLLPFVSSHLAIAGSPFAQVREAFGPQKLLGELGALKAGHCG